MSNKLTPSRSAYLRGFIMKCAENKVNPIKLAQASKRRRTSLRERLANIARFVPFVGGGLHGIAVPERGASRGETALYEGLLGLLGGGAGFGLGAHLGQSLADRYGLYSPEMSLPKTIAMLGAGLGTAIGTIPGRFLARRDVPDYEDLEELSEALKEVRESIPAGSSVTVNIGDDNPSSEAPLEADRESGEVEVK